MNDVVFQVLVLVITVAAAAVARYAVPWLKERIGAEKFGQIAEWTEYVVLMAQQVLWQQSGQDKKTYVTKFLKEMLTAKNISITDEQLDVLIEAAVKQMKIAENAGNQPKTEEK